MHKTTGALLLGSTAEHTVGATWLTLQCDSLLITPAGSAERADPLGVRRTSSGPQELTSPSSAIRESTRLRNKAANTLKAKQEAQQVQLDTGDKQTGQCCFTSCVSVIVSLHMHASAYALTYDQVWGPTHQQDVPVSIAQICVKAEERMTQCMHLQSHLGLLNVIAVCMHASNSRPVLYGICSMHTGCVRCVHVGMLVSNGAYANSLCCMPLQRYHVGCLHNYIHAAEAFSSHPSQISQQYAHQTDRTHGSILSNSTHAAAQAAQRVKHACTIDEDELLALRPTLLKGYAAMQDHSRSAVTMPCCVLV